MKVLYLCYLLLNFPSETESKYFSNPQVKHLENIDGYETAVQDLNNWHVAMLNDHDRNLAYYHALKATITNESVVLDIGTGASGLLAMMAARLGARKVFTIEENQVIAIIASETIERNGLSGVISLSVCSSFRLKVDQDSIDKHCIIPELATVLVSEVLSTTLVGEGVVRAVEDARRRLCVSNAVVIPTTARLHIAVIQSHELFASSYASHWGGFDLKAVNVLRNTHSAMFVDLCKVSDRKYLTPTQTVVGFDFEGNNEGLVGVEYAKYLDNGRYVRLMQVQATHSGYAHFVCSWFSVGLTPSIILSTDPEESLANPMRQRHWGQACTPTAFARSSDRRPRNTARSSLRADFLKHMEDHANMEAPKALKVCEGDSLMLSASMDLTELGPDPKLKLNWPWSSRHGGDCS